MNENVLLTVIGCNEAEAFFGIVPFDRALALQLRTRISGGLSSAARIWPRFRDLIADLLHLHDLMTSWTFFNRDLETCPLGNSAASGNFQHSDVQMSFRAVRQFDEAKNPCWR
ncbi:MAG: hypothetical protein EOR99_33295 [Mesorhizobium sp.]|nr:MAG: hypothetical protein EOR99_33295 [Mesorhizobium sp.]